MPGVAAAGDPKRRGRRRSTRGCEETVKSEEGRERRKENLRRFKLFQQLTARILLLLQDHPAGPPRTAGPRQAALPAPRTPGQPSAGALGTGVSQLVGLSLPNALTRYKGGILSVFVCVCAQILRTCMHTCVDP